MPLWAAAQIVQPVKWTGEELGDSVRLTATIDEGWHLTIISLADREWNDEYSDSFSVTLAKTELTPIRFNACDDRMCTAPETWEFESMKPSLANGESTGDGARGLLWIFLLGFLGGLLAIFTPCVWPIIPMTVSFFLKRTDKGAQNAILYGLSIIVLYVGLGPSLLQWLH